MIFKLISTSGDYYKSLLHEKYIPMIPKELIETCEKDDEYSSYNVYVNLNSLEDMKKLFDSVDHQLIITEIDNEIGIEIYDDWKE